MSKNSPGWRPNFKAAFGLIVAGAVLGLSSLSIVHAEQDDHGNGKGKKVFTCATGTACLEGNSTGNNVTYGVFGNAANGDGVHGVTASAGSDSGVAGIATASSGSAHGVYGRSISGDGVYGASTGSTGVYGTSANGDGIDGKTSGVSGFGVYGTSTSSAANAGAAVYGYAKQGAGLAGESGGGNGGSPVIFAEGDTKETPLFEAIDGATGAGCGIDPGANLSCSGTIEGSTLVVRQRSTQGHRVLAYTPRAATETIEDFGTARMIDGVANVQISSDFASVMDRGWYYVFLTPDGDTRGLYVNARTAVSFQVRENEHGRSNVAFDYRIVAHPLGASNDRLPVAPRLVRPRLPIAAH